MLDKPVHIVTDRERFLDCISDISHYNILGFDTETTMSKINDDDEPTTDPFRDKIRLIQIGTPEAVWVIDCFQVLNIDELRPIIESDDFLKIGANLKFDNKMLKTNYRMRLSRIFDTMLSSKIIDSGIHSRVKGWNSLGTVAERFLQVKLDKSMQKSNWGAPVLSEEQIIYAAKDVMLLHPLMEKMTRELKLDGLVSTAHLEFKCVDAVAQMELNGVYVDQVKWYQVIDELVALEKQISTQLKHLLGRPDMNLRSPKQVVDALNSKLGLKLEGSAEDVLEPYSKQSEEIALLLEHREIQKMLSSYGYKNLKKRKDKKSFIECFHPDTGRVHSSFNQIGAASGRFSSSEPNIQQIPKYDEERRFQQINGFREAFTAPGGRILVDADYSQMELRILAELSQDPMFIEGFRMGGDFHKATAAMMFGVPVEDVTKQMRSAAKSINFGLAYGRGPRSLAAQIGVDVDEAKKLIFKYFSTYAGVDRWLQNAGRSAVRNRMCRTLGGRVRRFAFEHGNMAAMGSAEREGKNTPIQGTNADITKLAMIKLNNEFYGTPVKMVNCIHDELVFECPKEVAEDVARVVQDNMREAAEYFLHSVPIVCDANIAMTWAEAH